jgi:hypothetical protein
VNSTEESELVLLIMHFKYVVKRLAVHNCPDKECVCSWKEKGKGQDNILRIYCTTKGVEGSSCEAMSRPVCQQLCDAAENGRVDDMRRLVEEERAYMNATDAFHRTVLMRASANGHEAAVDYLLSVGANINRQCIDVST